MHTIPQFRTDAPLTEEQWKTIDERIKKAARPVLIARKLVDISGPYGFGKEAISYDKLTEVSDAIINIQWGAGFSEDIVNLARTTINIPVLHKAYRINRRNLEASRTKDEPLDLMTVDSATYKVSKLEDAFILKGYAADGTVYDIKGLYEAAGLTEATAKDFATAGNAVDKINLAAALLEAKGIYPPYNLVLNPTQFREMHGLISNTGIIEATIIKELIKGDIIETSAMTAATGMLLSTPGRGFFDVAIGVDMTHEAEMLSLKEGGDLYGIVYECLVPRIWETNAICKLTSI